MTVAQEMAKEQVPDHEFAGLCAAQVHANWADPAYRNALTFALGTFIENEIWAHRHEYQAMVNHVAGQETDKVKRSIVKAYLGTKIQEIQKDVYDVRGNRHATNGRFGSKGPRGGNGKTGLGGLARAYALHQSELRPSPDAPADMDGVAAYQRYATVPPAEADARLAARLGDTVNAYSNRTGAQSPQGLHFTIEDKHGNERSAVSRDGKLPELEKDERVTEFKPIGIDQPITLGGNTFNLLQALGSTPEGAGMAAAIAQGLQQNAKVQGGHFARLHDASKTFYQIAGGATAPPAAQAAAAMGVYVGKYGPEVSRVLGPHIRRYTYKYRGMIANPTQMSQTAKDGIQPGEDRAAFEQKLAIALASDDPAKGGISAIPTQAENNLLLQTGSTAPSHGFIVDRLGKVKQQAVGVADDHYVPFNLAELHSLSGGSYVRSRVYGGPTTEDLSLALRTNADHFTTISRHGKYTVNFENRKGVRARYGDVPVVVVNRYGHLLDAVKSGQINDPANGAGGKLTLNGRGYEAALHALKTQFPLLIKSIDYTPPSDMDGLSTHKERDDALSRDDSGYIRPMYLKPSAASSGYFDPLLGGRKGFDDLEAYRYRKATLLIAKSKALEVEAARLRAVQAAAEAQRVAAAAAARGNGVENNQQNVKNGQPIVPAGMPDDATAQAEGGGGTVDDHVGRIDTQDTSKLITWMKAALTHANDLHDPSQNLYRSLLNGEYSDDKDELRDHNAFVSDLQNDDHYRNNVIQEIMDMAPDSGTGLELFKAPHLPSAGSDSPAVVADTGQTDAAAALSDHDAMLKTPHGIEYSILKQAQAFEPTAVNWRKNLAAGTLGEEKATRLATHEKQLKWLQQPDDSDPTQTRLQAWTTDKSYGSSGKLTYQQSFENDLADARGEDPIHPDPDEEPSDAALASDNFDEHMLRGLGGNDLI